MKYQLNEALRAFGNDLGLCEQVQMATVILQTLNAESAITIRNLIFRKVPPTYRTRE